MNTVITFEDILLLKEEKSRLQQAAAAKYRSNIVALAVNMPGKIKKSPLIMDFLYHGLQQIRALLSAHNLEICYEAVHPLSAGPFAILAVSGEAAHIKKLTVQLEEAHAYGRLWDMDVYDCEYRQISRSELALSPRSCFICNQPAAVCVYARKHSPEELLTAAQTLLNEFAHEQVTLRSLTAQKLGTLAVEAMLMEAACAPAPGLVDRFNSGAHKDMDIFTFLKSSAALAPTMYACAALGLNHRDSLQTLLPALRQIGQKGEREMFVATANVNTQKGLIFLLGILVAAVGYCTQRSTQLSAAAVRTTIQAICGGLVRDELEVLRSHPPQRALTAGEKLYLEHGITGIRGEMAAGVPTLFDAGLPALKKAFAHNLSLNDALIQTLLAIMAHTQDTTILHRKDLTTLSRVQNDAQDILRSGGMFTTEGQKQIAALDRLYSANNISPGGSADLLAATYFLYKLGI